MNCHCGELTTAETDPDRLRHPYLSDTLFEYYCEYCADVRCDADYLACQDEGDRW